MDQAPARDMTPMHCDTETLRVQYGVEANRVAKKRKAQAG